MKQHPLDPVSLVFGGLLAVVGLFLVSSDAPWEATGAAWVLPSLLLIVGGAILWSTVHQVRVDTAKTEEEATEAEDADLDAEEESTPGVPDLIPPRPSEP